jgi:Transposase IS66 family
VSRSRTIDLRWNAILNDFRRSGLTQAEFCRRRQISLQYKTGDIVEVGCMMHARRKFYEARTSDPERSHQALAWISLLYDVEREARERATADYEAFVALRRHPGMAAGQLGCRVRSRSR